MLRVVVIFPILCSAVNGATAGTPEGAATRPEQKATIRIMVIDAPRPVADAVEQVERHFGRVVTYEDVSSLASVDIVDITSEVRRDGKTYPRVLGRRRMSIELVHTPAPGPIGAQVTEVLRQLVAKWNGSDAPVQFRVEAGAGAHHVIPVARRDASGAMQPYSSLLDTRITFPKAERSGFETLELIAKAVSSGTGRDLDVGMIPLNPMLRSRITVGAAHQAARDVLWQALHAVLSTLSWQILCGVGDDPTCLINVYGVRKAM